MKKIRNILSMICVLLLITTTCATGTISEEIAICKEFDIQEAIENANNGDIIIVPDGIYHGDIDFLGKSITVKSENGPANCIIQGGRHGVKFDNREGPASILQGFTITNCYPERVGGGIFCGQYAAPTIINCIITENIAEAIHNYESAMGGGVFCDRYSSPILIRCQITNNMAIGAYCGYAFGGGIAGTYASPKLSSCLIANNTAAYWWGHPDYHACGGGLSFKFGGDVVLNSCMIVNNFATDSGGGLYLRYGANATIQGCTFSENSISESGWGGGAISCMSVAYARIRSTILWADYPQEIHICGEYSGDDTVLVDINFSDIQGGQDNIYIAGWRPNLLQYGTMNIDSNPYFKNPENGDFHLSRDSPCIDAGENELYYSQRKQCDVEEKDIDWQPRVYDILWITYSERGPLDIGADEYYLYVSIS